MVVRRFDESAAAGPGETRSYEDLWRRCVHEASTCGALIVYAEPDDVLKGGLVEVGAALGNDRRVFAVGVQPGWSFAHHRLVTKCNTLDEALALIAPEQMTYEQRWAAKRPTNCCCQFGVLREDCPVHGELLT